MQNSFERKKSVATFANSFNIRNQFADLLTFLMSKILRIIHTVELNHR